MGSDEKGLVVIAFRLTPSRAGFQGAGGASLQPGCRNGNYMGGCQNYGPFLGPHYSTAPNI